MNGCPLEVGPHGAGGVDVRPNYGSAVEDKLHSELSEPLFVLPLSERRRRVTEDASRQLVHELRTHQIELELQNEELRRTQVELAASRARYFDLYDHAPVGYCTVDGTGTLLEANLTLASMLGVSCVDLAGRSVQKLILPLDQDIYYMHRQRLFVTRQPQSCVLRLLRSGGKPFWAELSATFDQAASQDAIHRLVVTDVDERKVAQDQIRISDIALKAVSQGVLITCPEHHVISANQAFRTMFGYSAEELQGFDCAHFNGARTDVTAIAAFRQAVDTRQEFAGELLNYRKDGSSFWNEIFVSPVYDDQGHIIHFVSINTDITERKKLQQDLQERNLQLQLATQIAEKANMAKSDFLSSMSHELRTPLNSILGFAQLLESGTPPPTTLQQLRIEMIQRGGWYLLSLINEILDLATIEAGKVTLSLAPVSVAKVLADCQSMIAPDAERSGIRIDFPSMVEDTQVVADPIRLKQVIVNLLSNAIKYNRVHGRVEVRLSVEIPHTLRISIHDTGIGLSAESLSQLFQPFNRLGQQTGDTEGTGIGLVVTRRLTELMGGNIGVSSVPGEGSVFWVELCAVPELPASDDSVQGILGRAVEPMTGERAACTVLYVEDNNANLNLVKQILDSRPEIQLLTARNGKEGIAMAGRHMPQVILMDMDLPDMTGVDVLKILQKDPSTRNIPVLAVTANAMPLDIANGLASGFFRYLTKPFRIQEFLDVLDLAVAFATAQAFRAEV